ncbi:MAG: phosphate acyltransferase PlsX [Thermohalobaculum sp.]|nr:phosphate acyltransferase PlsX [Thermohalobaculum sp.]
MTRATVISVDAMGGDKGPAPVLGGLNRALRDAPQLSFILHGDEKALARLLRKRSFAGLRARVELRHTDDVVRMADKPSRALREHRGSSMWNAIETVKSGEAGAVVSAGNTGALMAMSVLLLRKAPGIDRPAIAVHWPSRTPHGYNTVLDMGADIRADARNLVQYAVMGAEYARLNFGLVRPRVGILNVGTEAMKGRDDLRDALRVLTDAASAPDADFDCVGFVEGTQMFASGVDVFVTDGFTGNIALKTAEGTAAFVSEGLRAAFSHSLLSRLAALVAMGSLKRFARRIDPRRVNGGVFLGLNGAVIKSHGSADAVGFEAAVRLAAKMAATDFASGVEQRLARINDMTAADRARNSARPASEQGGDE